MGTDKKAIVQFDEFTYQYRAQQDPSLIAINLTIYEGEKVLIVGPSGSGKSTLAHCMNGLAPFFYPGTISGSLRIGGKETRELSLSQLADRVGTVLQDSDGQFVGLTVAEDIAFQMENEGLSRSAMVARVHAAAIEVGIDAHLGASPHTLSGGQKQRTALAGVQASDVDLLLFDEPLASLDPRAGKRAIELIDRIHAESGKTIIIIEHRLEDVLHRNVDRIIVMNEGQIVADLSPNELLCSGILAENGIREPLYVTSLRYAGCTITPELHPRSLTTLQLDTFREPLQAWDAQLGEYGEDIGTAEKEPLLELRDVTFGYDLNEQIIHHLSLKVHQGEIICIAGPNGAGKSTLSKLICGFYPQTEGSIRYKGRDISGDTIKERAERIGYVMQHPNHMMFTTRVYDEVVLGLQTRGVDTAEMAERANEVLRICGLYPYRNWPISALSFGQKKRVTIASILVLRPDILILDEPTAGQDYKHYNEMMEFMLQLNKLGLTIIMITHDMHLMLEYSHRTIVLSSGRIAADDRPDRILTDAALLQEAHLNETSLMELAELSGIADPRLFVRRFIKHDRRIRAT
ncbi:ABC transporter ATP-binding protein [Paenibacillus sp. GCM10023252]|uniref:ABC transporter ATP-binding protein n=1 Tax=Paenibacillus sp. GCM10023252 TaxID=3252649 RepID=UPI003620A952